jgi:WD40 repeat protein
LKYAFGNSFDVRLISDLFPVPLAEDTMRVTPINVVRMLLGSSALLFAFAQDLVRAADQAREPVFRLGHASTIQSVSVSPDGRRLATASDDRTLRIWDTTSGAEIRILEHDASVRAVAFLSNAELVTGTSNGDLIVWDIQAGHPLRNFTASGPINKVAPSPDGKVLWCTILLGGVFAVNASTSTGIANYEDASGVTVGRTAGSDGSYIVARWTNQLVGFGTRGAARVTVEWWRDSALSRSGTTFVLDKQITSAAVTPDGLTLLLGTADGLTYRLRGSHFDDQVSYLGHTGNVGSIDISSDNAQFVSAGQFDHLAIVRSTETGKVIRSFKEPVAMLDKAVFGKNPDDVLLVTGDGNSARLVGLASGREVIFRGPELLHVVKVQSTLNRRHLLAATWGGANVWDLTTGESQSFGQRTSMNAAAISPDAKKVFLGASLPYDSSQHLIARDVRTGKEVGRFAMNSAATAAVYSSDRRFLAAGESTGIIRVWSANTGQLLRTMSGHVGDITTLVFGPGILLSEGNDDTARAWNLETGEELWRENAQHSSAEVFSINGALLGAWRGNLRIIDVKHHKELAQFEDAWANFAFANDDTLLFANNRKSVLESWSAARSERREIRALQDPTITTIVPLAGTLALVCEQRTATLIDWTSGKEIRRLENAECSRSAGPLVLVDSGVGDEVWNALTNKRYLRLPKRKHSEIESFSASADGGFLVTTNDDFKVETWNLHSGRRVQQEDDSRRHFRSASRSELPAIAANVDTYFASTEPPQPPRSTVTVWIKNSRRRLFTQPYAIESMDVSPDGKRLVTCGGDSTMRVLNASTGRLLAKDECWNAKFSPNGALITSTNLVNDFGPARVSTADLRHRLPGLDYRPAEVRDLAVSKDASKMVTLEHDNQLRVWDLNKGEELGDISPPIGVVGIIQGVELLAGGGFAVAALSTGDLWIGPTSGSRPGITRAGHKGRIRLIRRALENDQVFLSAGEDNSVRVWDLVQLVPARVLENLGEISTAALSGDASLVLVGGLDRSIRIFEVKSGRLLHSFNVVTSPRCVAFNADKSKVLVGFDSGLAQVIDIDHGRAVREIRMKKPEPLISVEWLGGYIVTSSSSGTIVWTEEGVELRTYTNGGSRVSRTFIDSNQNITTLNGGNGAHLWHLGYSPSPEAQIFFERVSSVAASPDGRHIAVGYLSGWLRIWDMQSLRWSVRKRVSKSYLRKLTYSADGTGLLISPSDEPAIAWDVTKGEVSQVYSRVFDIRDLAFAGTADKFVVIASGDNQLRVFDRYSGTELCSLVALRDGDWLVARADGLFDGSDEAVRSLIGSAPGSPGTEHGPSGDSVAGFHRAGLLAAIFADGIAPPSSTATRALALPASQVIRFDSPSRRTPPPTNAMRSPDDLPPHGLGLRSIVEIFSNVLGVSAQLTVNDGFRIETLDDRRIEVGAGALEKVFQGQSFASSIGLTAFILAHEAWHSRQTPPHGFGELTAEGHRLLECQADVLGARDAVRLVMAFGDSKMTSDAYASVRTSQQAIAAMSTLEAGDVLHPSLSQRQWAVEFGNARFAASVLKDDPDLVKLDRRFDARNPGDDEAWARGVCKRLIQYRLADQGKVAVSIQNERRTGGRWDGEVVYRNLTDHTLQVSAQVRLVGTAISMLTDEPLAAPAHIDSHLASFTLSPAAEHVEHVSLAELDLPAERVEATGMVYSSNQRENWMSVEDTDVASLASAVTVRHQAEGAAPASCVEASGAGALTERQRRLGAFLFQASNHASDGFQIYRRGSAIALPGLSGQTGYAAEIGLGEAKSANVTIDKNGISTLSVTLGSGQTRVAADVLFQATAEDLRALCAGISLQGKETAAPSIAMKLLEIPEFARNVNLSLTLLELKDLGTSTVTLTMRRRN